MGTFALCSLLILVAVVGLVLIGLVLKRGRQGSAQWRAVLDAVDRENAGDQQTGLPPDQVANGAQGAAPPTGEKADNTFTVGSTTREVMRVQGLPTEITSDADSKVFKYGDDQVLFQSDKCYGWNNSSHSLRVYVATKSRATTFTLGSTRDEVVAAMGTPQVVGWQQLRYEYVGPGRASAQVEFNDRGRVTAWNNAANILKLTNPQT